MALTDELQEISGIGEVKASEIIEVVEQHGKSVTKSDLENLKSGIDYVENGQPDYAMKFFNRVEL